MTNQEPIYLALRNFITHEALEVYGSAIELARRVNPDEADYAFDVILSEADSLGYDAFVPRVKSTLLTILGAYVKQFQIRLVNPELEILITIINMTDRLLEYTDKQQIIDIIDTEEIEDDERLAMLCALFDDVDWSDLSEHVTYVSEAFFERVKTLVQEDVLLNPEKYVDSESDVNHAQIGVIKQRLAAFKARFGDNSLIERWVIDERLAVGSSLEYYLRYFDNRLNGNDPRITIMNYIACGLISSLSTTEIVYAVRSALEATFDDLQQISQISDVAKEYFVWVNEYEKT